MSSSWRDRRCERQRELCRLGYPLAMCNVLVGARAQAADVSFIARWDFGAGRYPGPVAECACADHGGIGTVSP